MLSIITPVLNGVNYIEKNILSILQLKIKYEHIIIDGGSIDGTIDIIKKYEHVKLFTQDKFKIGMYGALHQGIILSKGSFIACINADDYILYNNFSHLYDTIVSSNSDFIYSDAKLFNTTSKMYSYSKSIPFPKFFLKNGIMPFIQSSSIFKRDLYFLCGGYDFDKFRIIGDLDLYIKFSKYPLVKFKRINICSTCFLIRHDSLGNTNSDIVKIEKINSNILFPNLFIKFLYKLIRKIC